MGEIIYLLWKEVSANTNDISSELLGVFQSEEAATKEQIRIRNTGEAIPESWIEQKIVQY